MRRWSRRARALGGSLVEVLQAEIHSLLADFQRTGRGAVRGVALLLAAAALVFWSIGLLITFIVTVLAAWLGLWQAAGLTFLVVALAGLAVALWGMGVLKRLEAPTQIVRIHVDDHVQWWREALAPPSQPERDQESDAKKEGPTDG